MSKQKQCDQYTQALSVVSSIKKLIKSNKAASSLHKLQQNVRASHPHEPLINNTITYILQKKVKAELQQQAASAETHLKNSSAHIAEVGHTKIKKGMSIFVHGFSPAVYELLIKAKQRGIHFEVRTTESQPHYTGRSFASLLAKHNIPVKHYADLALRIVLKKSDLVLMPTTLIAHDGKVYSQLGAELIAEVAQKYDVPVYVVGDSWNYSNEISKQLEQHNELQIHPKVWSKPPRNVEVLNYGFEKIHPQLIAGIITELGILKPHYVASEIKQHYLF